MSLSLKLISYESLTSRQQETYNFQKVSAILADFGYLTIRLSDDWNGADFIAQHFETKEFVKVQLKGRLGFYTKYCDKDLYICFRDCDIWYLYPHDEVLNAVLAFGMLRGTKAWDELGEYHFPSISGRLKELLRAYRIPETGGPHSK